MEGKVTCWMFLSRKARETLFFAILQGFSIGYSWLPVSSWFAWICILIWWCWGHVTQSSWSLQTQKREMHWHASPKLTKKRSDKWKRNPEADKYSVQKGLASSPQSLFRSAIIKSQFDHHIQNTLKLRLSRFTTGLINFNVCKCAAWLL